MQNIVGTSLKAIQYNPD